jgi:hypothetical protein
VARPTTAPAAFWAQWIRMNCCRGVGPALTSASTIASSASSIASVGRVGLGGGQGVEWVSEVCGVVAGSAEGLMGLGGSPADQDELLPGGGACLD